MASIGREPPAEDVVIEHLADPPMLWILEEVCDMPDAPPELVAYLKSAVGEHNSHTTDRDITPRVKPNPRVRPPRFA